MTSFEIIAAILGSNVLAVILTRFFERRKQKAEIRKIEAEARHLSADEIKLLAEARKLNADTDHIVSEGWKQVADSLKEERDRALERINDLEKMLTHEEELNKIRQVELKKEHNLIVTELRDQLKIERQRYDERINEILERILKTKLS